MENNNIKDQIIRKVFSKFLGREAEGVNLTTECINESDMIDFYYQHLETERHEQIEKHLLNCKLCCYSYTKIHCEIEEWEQAGKKELPKEAAENLEELKKEIFKKIRD